MTNLVFLKGNVTQPPYFDRVGEDRRPFLRLYLAVDSGGGHTDFPRVVAYDELAETAYGYLRVGSELFVSGRLRTRKITRKEGDHIIKETVVEVVAHDITFLRGIEWEAGEEMRQRIEAARDQIAA